MQPTILCRRVAEICDSTNVKDMGSLATAAICSEVNMEILIKNLLNHSLQAIFNPTRTGPWNQQMSHQPPHYTHMHGIWWQCVIWHSVVSFGRWLDLCLECRSHRQKVWDQLVFLCKCYLPVSSPVSHTDFHSWWVSSFVILNKKNIWHCFEVVTWHK